MSKGSSGVAKKIVMLDTSVLLHYKLPSDIDWLKAVNADEVEIVLTRTVISELNAHKDRRTSRWESKRADAVIKYLQKIWGDGMEAEIRKSTRLRLEPRSPLISFADHGLNKDVPDDWIIATAIELHNEFGSGFLFITNDIGQEAALRSLGVQTIWWGDNSYRLADQLDPTEQENARLKIQIQEYENRIPKLSVEFDDGQEHRVFALSAITPEQMKVELDSVWKAHNPTLHRYDLSVDIDRYDWACREHYEAYQSYLKALSVFRERVVALDLILANSGTCMADDIDTYLTFPQGLDLRDRYELPHKPAPPDPKDYLRSDHDPFDREPGLVIIGVPPTQRSKAEAERAVINPSEGSASYHIAKAKHHQPVKLGTLYVVFEEPERAGSFSIQYRLLSSNVPQPVEGVIHVEVRTGQTEGRSEEETR